MIWTMQWVAGQLFDATVGRMVSVLGAPWTRPSGGRGASGVSPLRPTAAWEPPRGGTEVLKDKDLEGDDTKLVRYAIVSLRPCHERLLPDGSGQVLVTVSMTGETFATWIIACYLQAEDHPEEGRDAAGRRRRNEIPHAEKRYLRVTYEVLYRWPSEPLDCCETRELHALQGIRDAIRELPLPKSATEETEAPTLAAVLPAADEDRPPADDSELAEDEQEPVLQALHELGGRASIGQVARQMGRSKTQVRKSLKALMGSGRIGRSGEGKDTRYHAVDGEE